MLEQQLAHLLLLLTVFACHFLRHQQHTLFLEICYQSCKLLACLVEER
jgi:hypothetical protein